MSYGRAKGWQTKPKPGCFIDPTHPLSLGLVGCWLFNEEIGSKVFDVSVNRYTGSLNSTAVRSGSPMGGGVRLNNGGPEAVDFGTILNFTSAPFSLVFTGTLYGIGNGAGYLIDSSNFFSTGGYIFSLSTLKLAFALKGVSTVTTTLNGFALNSRSCVVASWDGAECKFYSNGSFLSSHSIAGDPTASLPFFRIGNRNGSDRGFPGVIDDVRVYSRTLSSDEAFLLYSDPYANILSPVYRRYFIPVTVGGIAAKAMHQYRQRRLFV